MCLYCGTRDNELDTEEQLLPAVGVQVRLSDGLKGSPDQEAEQGEGQGGEEEKQVEGCGDQDTQGEEWAGVLGALTLFQRGGHTGGQQPVQEPVAGENQAPWQAVQEEQTGTGVRGSVEDHLSPSFFLSLPLCCSLSLDPLSTPTYTPYAGNVKTCSRDYIKK